MAGYEIRVEMGLQDMRDAKPHLSCGREVAIHVAGRIDHRTGPASCDDVGTVGYARDEKLPDNHLLSRVYAIRR